ncbi:hypothetical protein BUALT_Bualt06G0110500 [Buddleja alternifolia]|uniref:Leucine-rich repeat-containing N-terminal plant-type domain-containing protein n=1 Tax=Buddleja alternifolia TaxID=168488 RepID=A0AAV6XQB2_9LAMI|nr:hypothetical protein BUALT_Bualt06G0110500 [Buddleja alternifolia]
MGILKMSSSISLFIILLTMEFAICCCGKNSSFGCIPRERKALLKFKASLLDISNRLSSWDDYKDCCVWDGVKCDKTTGHVIGLDLRNSNTSSYEMFLQTQGNQLDSSLLELKYLSYLDLSYNDFQLGPIPSFLGSMKQLRYLNLSATNFNGIVPHDLWSNLINHLPRNIGHMMPLLELFAWSQNSINGSIPESLCEMKALRNLDLSNNYFFGTIPDCWENSQDLLVMRLSSNELSGIIPNSIGGAYSLQWLRLNNNSLIRQLPSSLKNCTNLELIDVGENKLSGTLPRMDWKRLA